MIKYRKNIVSQNIKKKKMFTSFTLIATFFFTQRKIRGERILLKENSKPNSPKMLNV